MLALALACVGCGAEENKSLLELEGLSFVPKVDHSLADEANLHPGDWGLENSILIDRFEVTRGAFLGHLSEQGRQAQIPSASWSTHSYDWASEDMALPAEMTYSEAEELASARGMRLPTAGEWLHVAMGSTGQRYPWEGLDQLSVCNSLEAGIGEPTLVGTFASGRSPLFDCYDLLGNVWEWTSTYVPGHLDSSDLQNMMVSVWGEVADELEIEASPDPILPNALATRVAEKARLVSVMGGSFSSQRRELFDYFVYENGNSELFFHSRTVDMRSLTPEIGARMCADAEQYLWKFASSWGDSGEARERIRRVGKRWATDRFAREQLGALLRDLLERPDAPEGLRWLLKGVEGKLGDG